MLGIIAYVDLGSDAVHELGESLILERVDRHGGAMRLAFYAALISAVLSTASAAILAPSALIGLNIYRPLKPGLSDRELLRLTRRIVLPFAALSLWQGSAERQDFTESAGMAWLVDLGFGRGWLLPTSLLGLLMSVACMIGLSLAPPQFQARCMGWLGSIVPGRNATRI
jgi:Na+/proline symporter